jgi:putative iron-only hydrogenase system regulator
MSKRVGFIGIIIEDRKKSASQVNKVLSDYGEEILARVGIPYRERHCWVITLTVDMTTDELGALTGKLGAIEGITVKSALAKN